MDVRLETYVYLQMLEKERIDKLLSKLNIAEAVYFGSLGFQSKEGRQDYINWRKRIEREITGDDRPLIWDLRKKKSQKLN